MAYVTSEQTVTISGMGIRLAHFSDSHVGYEAYKALAVSGENQRSVDVAKSFVNIVSDIISTDPPLVVHSGDMADRTIIPVRLILLIRAQIARLASIRPDGSRRQVVLIAGNHEIPRSHKEACFLHLLDGLPGVQVVTNKYSVLEFAHADAPKELRDTLVHALPHDVLKTVDYETVVPVEGKYNILCAHGVAGGSELYVRSLGREFAIPTTVLARSWDYGALGHWHKQGPVPVGKRGREDDGTSYSRIWYAGSGENMGFGDLRENGLERGWLNVEISPEKELTVTRRNLPIRHMLKLPQVDGAQKSVETIEQELIDNINSHSIQGAVVSQTVINVPRDTWSLVNLSKIRLAAKASLHYEVVSRPQKDTGNKPAIKKGALGNIDELLEECAKTILADHEREPGVRLARTLLQDQMETMNASLPKNEEDSRETGEDQKPLEKVTQEETA